MRIGRIIGLLVLAVALTTAGCGTYYQITDPATKRVYYTDEIKRTSGGTVQFRDAKSGAEVTLPTSEVLEVSSDDFKKNTAK